MAPAATAVAGAHLMPPDVRQRLVRSRLHDELDRLRAAPGCKLVWIGAPSGSGKTTLAAAWAGARAAASMLWLRLDDSDGDPATLADHWHQALVEALRRAGGNRTPRPWPRFTREHLARPLLQLRRNLRALCAALADDAVIVFDDVQACGTDDTITPLLRMLVDELRAGQCALLLSQRPWPADAADLLARGALAALEPAHLAFDAQEVQAWGAQAARPERAMAWLEASAGWPLALGWLAAGQDPQGLAALMGSALLQGLDGPSRAALDTAAWCPVADATVLSPQECSALQRLCGAGLPIDATGTPQAPGYRLHDLLRRALQQAQREQQAPAALAARLAGLADRLGPADPEAALALRLQAAALDTTHWRDADAALCGVAPGWLAAARHGALREHIRQVPEGERSAALWLWLAQAELPRSPSAARHGADQALARLPAGDTSLAPACHALAIATHFQSFDDTRPLAARVAALRALGVSPASCDVTQTAQAGVAVGVWSALFLRQPTHPDCAAWQERVRALLHEAVDPNLKLRAAMLLAKQGWYQGQHGELAALPALVSAESTSATVLPYARLLWSLMQQYVTWATADWQAGVQGTHQALGLADEVGIHLLDNHLRLHGACFASLGGDDALAQRWLDDVAAQADAARHMEAWHHFCVRGWLALRRGDAAAAEAASRVAIEAAQAMGPAPHAMALALRCHALQVLEDLPALNPALRELAALACATENRLAALHLQVIGARTARDDGNTSGSLHHLQHALAAVRASGLWAPFGIEPRGLAVLLADAMAAGVQRDAACRLARALRLAPPPQAGPHWPWPVRVRTLGGFAIEVDGQPALTEGKPQKRPLELLQALIALGGSASRDTLADLLWPQAEGDRAVDAFEVALRRLRGLLGDANALSLSGGRLALDLQRVWVDVLQRPGAAPATVPDFLPDQAAHWALAARERLARGAPLAGVGSR